MDIIWSIASKILEKTLLLINYHLIVDAYSKFTRIYGMESMSAEDIMDKLYMFQAISGKLYEFGWWDLERIQTDTGMQFTSMEF